MERKCALGVSPKKTRGDVVAYDNVFVCAKPRGTWNSRACVNDGFAVCGK